jgi:hypothetical protein
MISILVVLNAAPLIAEEPTHERTLRAARDLTWGFLVAPYGWLTGVEGMVVTDGEAVDIKVPFEDFAKHTHAGLQLYFEARRNNCFVGFDGTDLVQQGPVIGGGYSF